MVFEDFVFVEGTREVLLPVFWSKDIEEDELHGIFDFTVRYTYDGDAEPDIVWMTEEDAANYRNNPSYEYTALPAAPSEPGYYVIMISAPQTLKYYGVAPVLCQVDINKIERTITIVDKSHVFGSTPSTPLYEGSTSGITSFSVYIVKNNTQVALSSTTNAGVYDIMYDLS